MENQNSSSKSSLKDLSTSHWGIVFATVKKDTVLHCIQSEPLIWD